MDALEKEATLFSSYLVSREASPQAVRLYANAMNNSEPSDSDKKILHFMTKHKSSIGFIDAGLVITNPTSEVRRRLYVMTAILEASTEHQDLFLPKKRSPWYVFAVMYTGIRAVMKAIFGILLLKVVA